MDLKTFEANPQKQAGTWIEYGDARFLIASAQEPAYRRALRKRLGKIPANVLKANPELGEKATAEVMAKHVLLDWEGVTRDGKTLKPTEENRLAALQIPAFGDWVASQSLDLSNFQEEGEAEDVAAMKSGD